jgi:hypothetical protein
MLEDNAGTFRKRLRTIGLSDSVIDAAWPTWWSDDADASSSARAELRYSLARKLGLEPHSLLEDQDAPQFVWKEPAQFKHMSGETDIEKWVLTSFGSALGKILSLATTTPQLGVTKSALELRAAILESQVYVRFVDLLALCWSLGIPTVHLRVFPLTKKRMAAMSVRVGTGYAILLGKDATYPPQIAFYLAHELAHIFLNHVKDNEVLVDLDRDGASELQKETDEEEIAADAFALELLTGFSELQVFPIGLGAGARSLAKAALEAAPRVRVEPGTLALCFGHSTGKWASAIGALPYIYGQSKDVWREVNSIALSQLSLSAMPDDMASYLRKVLGEVS